MKTASGDAPGLLGECVEALAAGRVADVARDHLALGALVLTLDTDCQGDRRSGSAAQS